MGLSVVEWVNPYPELAIKELDFFTPDFDGRVNPMCEAIVAITGIEPIEQDLIEIAKNSLGQMIQQAKLSAIMDRSSADKALEIGRRFHVEKGENFLFRLLEDKAKEFNKKAERADHDVKVLERALEIAGQYRFDFQVPQPFYGGLGSQITVVRMG